jgi:hypothetical protein
LVFSVLITLRIAMAESSRVGGRAAVPGFQPHHCDKA